MQNKRVVSFRQLFQVILLQTDEPFKVGTVPTGAVEAVNNVLLFLFLDEEDVEDFLFTLATVMGGFVLSTAVESNLNAF